MPPIALVDWEDGRRWSWLRTARRWAVERTFSWINRCRRTVRDYERRPEHRAAMVQWPIVIIMTRRLARYTKRPQTKAT